MQRLSTQQASQYISKVPWKTETRREVRGLTHTEPNETATLQMEMLCVHLCSAAVLHRKLVSKQ